MSQKKTVKKAKPKAKKVAQRSMEDTIRELTKAREAVARLEKEVNPNVKSIMEKLITETVKSFKIPWDYIKRLQAQREIADGDREPDDVDDNLFQLVIESNGHWILQSNYDDVLEGNV